VGRGDRRPAQHHLDLVHLRFILGGALSLFLEVVNFLIAAMDNPLRGEVSVGPDAFELDYNRLMTAK
jgi:hypothetical protein